jgi:hypothetical protein
MKFTNVLLPLSLLIFCARAANPHPNTVELALMSSVGKTDGVQYYVNFTVGTPGQLQTLFIDTGSANTFVFASNVSVCETSGCDGGTFDPSKSSTYENVNPGAFVQKFMRGRIWFKGDYIREVVQMSMRPTCEAKRQHIFVQEDLLIPSSDNLVISKLSIGLANRLKSTFKPYTGIMGLGYSKNINHERDTKELPPNFLEGLVQAGAISSRLYSIYLNTLDQYGSILFGGLDTDKYRGPLTTLNCLRQEQKENVDNFFLYLEDIKMQPYNRSSQTILQSPTDGTKRETVIDTGTPTWQLPHSAYDKLVESVGGSVYYGSWVRPCSEVARGLSNTTHFEITFAGNGSNTATLRLELADLFSPVTTEDSGSAVTDGTGRPLCRLMVVPASPFFPFVITSNSVMRAGYWVFDLDNGQISLAQANLGANSSNVVQVEAGPEGIKKAANNLRAETQLEKVEGTKLASMSYELSTATNTIGYATGIELYPTPTSAADQTPSNSHSSRRSGDKPHARRAENVAATMMGSGAHGIMVVCVAITVAVVTLVI